MMEKRNWGQDRLVVLLEQPSDPALCNLLYLATRLSPWSEHPAGSGAARRWHSPGVAQRSPATLVTKRSRTAPRTGSICTQPRVTLRLAWGLSPARCCWYVRSVPSSVESGAVFVSSIGGSMQ